MNFPLPPLLTSERLASIASRFGTPTYVYDATVIRRRLGELTPFATIRYAVKACSNLSILRLLRAEGCVADVVSGGEIYRALTAGFRPRQNTSEIPPIVYTADVLDRDAVPLIRQHGIPVNLGSPDMLDDLVANGLRVPLVVRINPGFGHGHSSKTNTGGPFSKHGIWYTELPAVRRRVEELGLRIVGCHVHIGSGADFAHLARVAEAVTNFASQLGEGLAWISGGGGLPVPYQLGEEHLDIRRFQAIWAEALREVRRRCGPQVRLEIEPGRYLVAESGVLITTLLSTKTMGDIPYYLVDAGFDALARPILYGSYHHISVIHRTPPPPGEIDVVVAGPLCESGDVFTQNNGGEVVPRRLPRATRGDHLVLHTAGAYGFAMASNYNSRRRPAEVLVDGTANFPSVTLIRERETLNDLVRGESL